MDNIIDLSRERQRRHPEPLTIPEARIPVMTVHFFGGPDFPLRLVGVASDPVAIRAAAADLIQGAAALFAEAFRLDGDEDSHLRLLITLYASGKLKLTTYDAPHQHETPESVAKLRQHLSQLDHLLTRLHAESP